MATNGPSRFPIEPLAESLDRAAFRSGSEDLDRYYYRLAGQDLRRKVAVAFVAIENVTEVIAAIGVVVYAQDEAAVSFYGRFSFIRFQDAPRRMFIPMGTIARLSGEK